MKTTTMKMTKMSISNITIPIAIANSLVVSAMIGITGSTILVILQTTKRLLIIPFKEVVASIYD